MRIIIISDLHGRIENLEPFKVEVGIEKPDLILFSGDIVKGHARGDEWLRAKAEEREPIRSLRSIQDEKNEDLLFYREFYSALGSFDIPVFFVPGNMDGPWSRFWDAFTRVEAKNIHLVHRTFFFVGKLMIYGFGGEISKNDREDFFVLIYPESDLEKAFTRVEAEEKIYLFHHPPDDFAEGGSPLIRKVIERDQPLLVACGHKHKERKVGKIGKTTVINPGPLKDRRYALFDTEARDGELKEF